jgi:RNA polymerase sigma-70 factor (ECF subfamily)
VTRVLGGERAAFEPLVRRHFRASYAVAFARLGDRDEAEDVCQDAFVAAYERLAECRRPDRFAHWLLRIVRNRALRRIARQAVRRAVGLDRATEKAGGATPEDDLYRAELGRQLAAALGALRPIQREVVLLFDHEDQAHREIAERLGISEGMSRRHLSDARATMRKLLERYRNDEGG